MKGGTVLLAKTPLSTDLYFIRGRVVFHFARKHQGYAKCKTKNGRGYNFPAVFASCTRFVFIRNSAYEPTSNRRYGKPVKGCEAGVEIFSKRFTLKKYYPLAP